jgi:YD repeat-containing protein
VGWGYDATANLLNYGTTTSTYDALNRVLTATAVNQQRSSSYNGDGTLVAQTANDTTTRFPQRLAAPLRVHAVARTLA